MAEIQQIRRDLTTLLESQDQTSSLSVGILSPFRAQVDALKETMHFHFSHQQIEAMRLLIGTAHTFQGEERDVMFLSFAVSANDNRNVLRFLEQPNLFNVSITRARTLQHVYSSIDPNSLPTDSLLGRFLRYSRDAETQLDEAKNEIACEFMNDVAQACQRKGFRVFPETTIAGMTADLIIVRDDRHLIIDLIGYPGQYEAMLPIERLTLFTRAGLPFFALPFSQWYFDTGTCLEEIEQAWRGPT